MAKYRPRCPIIAVTRHEQVARQCHLWRGILPLHYGGIKNRFKDFLQKLQRYFSFFFVFGN